MVSNVTNPASLTMDVPPLLEELKSIQKELSQISKNISSFLASSLAPKGTTREGRPMIRPSIPTLLADENMQYVIEDCKQFGEAFSHAVNRLINSHSNSINNVLIKMDDLVKYLHEIRDAVTAWKGGGGGGLLEAVEANVLAEQLKLVFNSGPVQKAIASIIAVISGLSAGVIALIAVIASIAGLSFIADDIENYFSGKESFFGSILDGMDLNEEAKNKIKKFFFLLKTPALTQKDLQDRIIEERRIKEKEGIKDGDTPISNKDAKDQKDYNIHNHYDFNSPHPMSEYGAISSLSDAYNSRTFTPPRQSASASLPTTRQNVFHAENVVINTQSSDPKAIRREIDTWMQRECRLLIENSDSPFIA